MKKYLMIFALTMGIAGAANAQVADSSAVVNNNVAEELTLTKEVYPQQEEDGDMYHGLSRKLTFDRMIPPHGLEVTYDKTVHILFPSEVRYVDLGSPNLIAGKADGAENVIRVKATVKNFQNETNMQSVIYGSGTADSQMLSYLGLYENDKAVILSVVREDKVKTVLDTLSEKFEKVKNGKGIAFTVPMKSVIGVSIYQFLSNNQTVVKKGAES